MKSNISKLTPGYNLRWEASRMMLPEHVEKINEEEYKKNKVLQPILDEQKWQEINDLLSIAIEEFTPILLSIYHNGEIQIHHVYVNKFDVYQKQLHVTDKDGCGNKVNIAQVVDVTLS